MSVIVLKGATAFEAQLNELFGARPVCAIALS